MQHLSKPEACTLLCCFGLYIEIHENGCGTFGKDMKGFYDVVA